MPDLLFSVIFAAFSARAFLVATPDAHVLIVALLVGYAADVAEKRPPLWQIPLNDRL